MIQLYTLPSDKLKPAGIDVTCLPVLADRLNEDAA
jgi:hypothetical protein